jgi:protein-S-isoprenylcysteine O-methyltransferase Ste14
MVADREAFTLPAARSLRFLFRGQFLHASAAVVLAAVAWALAAPTLGDGSWLGVSDTGWFVANAILVVVHQLYTWLAFRGQLGWGVFTRVFGRFDLAAHAVMFAPLLVARPAAVVAVGLADPSTLALPRSVGLALGLALLVPALYTMYSVARYFGFERALGGDHFRRRYREMPLVEAGAFRWSPNAMYTFAFLGLWSLALLLGSHAALVAALFQHAFVWAHYLGTERPDMNLLYGR